MSAAPGESSCFGKQPSDHRRRAQHRQQPFGHDDRLHLFRFGEAGHALRVGLPHRHVPEHAAVLLVSEVEERRRAGVRQADAGGGVVEHDQLVGIRIRQRLEQHAFDHAEDRRIGADANRKREDGYCGEDRQLQESADDVMQAHISIKYGTGRPKFGIVTPWRAWDTWRSAWPRHARTARAIARTGGRRQPGPRSPCCPTSMSSDSPWESGPRIRGGTGAPRTHSRSRSSSASRQAWWPAFARIDSNEFRRGRPAGSRGPHCERRCQRLLFSSRIRSSTR